MVNKVKNFFRTFNSLYLNKNMLVIALLGYTKGIPYTLIFGTYTYKLAEDGVDLLDIGLLGVAGLPFAIKFLWSPLVDGYKIPILNKLGQRKSWIIFSQILLATAIALFGIIDPQKDLMMLAYLAVIISFISATYDIAYDALRIDLLEDSEQGAGAGASIVGYRMGVLTSGGISLILADIFSWKISFLIISASILITIIPAILSTEPKSKKDKQRNMKQWIEEFIFHPFSEFIKAHNNWLVIIIFIIMYKIGDALLGKMINPFYQELGFTKSEVAEITKFFGFAMTIIGGLVGGWAVYRLGIIKSLLIFGILQMVSNFSFVWLNHIGHDNLALTIVIALENITGAMGTTAFVAYMSSLCDRNHTATQYALFTSIESLGRWSTNAPSGYLVDAKHGLGLSWEAYFIVTVLISIPGLLLIKYLNNNNSRLPRQA